MRAVVLVLALPLMAAGDRVRALLDLRCVSCHNSKLRMGALDFSSDAGARGAAAKFAGVLSHAGKVKMPPTGKLADGEIRELVQWATRVAGEQWWSFRPVRKPSAALSALRPSALPANLALLRRVSYDLTGLPPSEEDVRAFATEGFERVVDRLLASPRYGEHWGRHWMDVARYAVSTGADEDHRYPYAWKYRDYVIDAFNRDLPYDQFVREQIAGDLLPAPAGEEVNARGIIATGFLAIGPRLIAEQDKQKMFYDTVDEELDVLSKTFLGLTIACARCHDHKFDPITTKDYYSLASILASTKQYAKLEGTVSQLYFAPLAGREIAERYERHQKKVEEKQKEIDKIIGEESARYRKRMAPMLASYMVATKVKTEGLDAEVLERWREYLKPTRERRAHLEEWYKSADFQAAARKYQAEFIAEMEKPKRMAGDNRFYTEVTTGKGPFALPEKLRETAQVRALREELKAIKAGGPPQPPLACGMSEGAMVNQRVFVRGNPEAPGEEVSKRFPTVLAGDNQKPIPSGSGRRELAEWIASSANPLTARVMVNRIWQWHFGEGLVRTPSNFGKLGEAPSDPELLDHLAARFVESGWSIKAMHRLILLSSAYRTQFRVRRLAVEEIHDSLLAIGGSLDPEMGGTLQKGEGTDKEFADDRKSIDPDNSRRRMVYLPLRRSNLPGVLNLFDFGDATTHTEGRAQTNVATQALYMMNGAFVARQAEALAKLTGGDVNRAYLRVLGRPASNAEIAAARSYVDRFPGPAELARTSMMRTLLASNEFLYVQ